MKRMIALLMSVCLVLALLSGCGGTTVSVSTQAPQSTEAVTETAPSGEQFSDGDYKTVSADTANATITLSGSDGTISDTTRGSSGSTVTITSKGSYYVTGASDGVQLVVDDSTKSGNVYLILDAVSMTNSEECIVVENADKVILQLSGGSRLTSTAPDKGAVYARDDLTVNGSGSLTVVSARHGVVCSNDLKVTDGTLTVTAEGDALRAGDTVRIGGGTLTLTAGDDGVQVDSDEGDGYFYMEGGVVTINAGYDGIDVGTGEAVDYTGYLQITGGTLSVTAGGGSGEAKGSESTKGLKCDGSVYLSGGTVSVSSADDAVHAGGDVTVSGGTVSLSSSDDGVHADAAVSITDGVLTVSKSYEGLEGETVTIEGGTISVYASDDGVNAAGGSDSSSDERGPWSQSANTGVITISGGELYVNAGGDGIDSNGSIYVTGGYTIVEGPTSSGNGALDKGDGSDCVCSITGGTVLALGTADMAVNFDSGSQCSALVSLVGYPGNTVIVNDGSGFSYTVSKAFSCAVYSSPNLREGQSYIISAGTDSATMDFSSGLYYSTVASMGGGMGGKGGPGGR